MTKFEEKDLKKLYLPPKSSHKGQNGKLTIVGGSHLFHGASLWALKVASRIVDMVFYSSIPENNTLAEKLKGEVFDFITVPRDKIEEYIEESDAVLIGPGLPREEGRMDDEESTRELTERLLKKFPEKKWVLDAGSLQTMDPEWFNKNCLITPHHQEFNAIQLKIKNEKFKMTMQNLKIEEQAKLFAQGYGCVILLKGPTDFVCDSQNCVIVEGGNEGMTKGGTGDVLAGLVAGLACKNDLFLAACAGSFINKKAGDELYRKVGPFFNASDLADEIPKVMKAMLF